MNEGQTIESSTYRLYANCPKRVVITVSQRLAEAHYGGAFKMCENQGLE